MKKGDLCLLSLGFKNAIQVIGTKNDLNNSCKYKKVSIFKITIAIYFQLIIKNINDEIVETYNYKLNDGNPNVNDVKSNLNGLLINKVLVSYDKQRN